MSIGRKFGGWMCRLGLVVAMGWPAAVAQNRPPPVRTAGALGASSVGQYRA